MFIALQYNVVGADGGKQQKHCPAVHVGYVLSLRQNKSRLGCREGLKNPEIIFLDLLISCCDHIVDSKTEKKHQRATRSMLRQDIKWPPMSADELFEVIFNVLARVDDSRAMDSSTDKAQALKLLEACNSCI